MAARKPILLDEPIQWHLSTSKHDRCPMCGGHVGYFGSTDRGCMAICGLQFKLPMSGKKWFDDRMAGGDPTAYDEDTSKVIGVPKYSRSVAKSSIGSPPTQNPMSLKEAQKNSLDSTAKIPIKVSPHTHTYVYWKAGEYEPKDEVKKEKILAGTPLWRALLTEDLWEPNDPKSVLDKLIADEDGPAKLLRRVRVAGRP